MVRNLVLALSSLAILIVLFAVYLVVVGTPPATTSRPSLESLPPRAESDLEPIQVGQDITVPAGGKIVFRVFDERTGRPTELFSCADWQPVPGSQNEIRVSEPELSMLLPSGMIAMVRADEGQLTGERVEEAQMRPREGWLTGNVEITIDRETVEDRTPLESRPQDQIVIGMDRLRFDLERGELRTESAVRVASQEFEIAGTGLDLVWNQADNRVETLTIDQGDEFVFYTPTDLFSAMAGDEEQPPTTQPTQPVPDRPESRTSYTCKLAGDIVVEQHERNAEGEVVLAGGLQADEVELLFDVGAAAGQMLSPTTAPATQPAARSEERLVVRWTGPLHLHPAPRPAEPTEPRLHFVARGTPVVLHRAEGQARGRRVEYHHETRRIWLEPMPDERVTFAVGNKLSAEAAGVFIDRAARIVKLIGPVGLWSNRGDGLEAGPRGIVADHWATLRIAARTDGDGRPADAVFDVGQLESASFVGAVRVDLAGQTLTGQQLSLAFRPDSPDAGFEASLQTAVASGSVRLASEDGAVDCAQLQIDFALTEQSRLYPAHMDASGAVKLTRGRAWVRGDTVQADLAPVPSRAQDATQRDQDNRQAGIVLRTLNVRGRAELIEPQRQYAARGNQIRALFTGENELHSATVLGTAAQHGLVHARPYTIAAERIDLDREALSLHVNGPSRLALKTSRSLQGRRRPEPTRITVSSSRRLYIDGRQNEIQFIGDVDAMTGEERLQSDTLTLLLEDVAPPPESPLRRRSWGELWGQVQQMMGAAEPAGGRDLFDMSLAQEDVRKEPRLLIAENALVTSETYQLGSETPVVHASISAPHLEADLASRQITTRGLTQLLMIDRRGVEDEEALRSALGVPSALMSRGPSQTAMQCRRRMVYSIGAEGPDRRDTVLFEEGVQFRHRTGREMVGWEEMLGPLAEDPERLARLQSRNAALDAERLEVWFKAAENQSADQRGGALTSASLELVSLLASGRVYLRDEEGPRIREVHAPWVEFNREQGRIHVRGSETAGARIYFENTATGQSDVHIGDELTINLRDGTIRTEHIEGEMRRP